MRRARMPVSDLPGSRIAAERLPTPPLPPPPPGRRMTALPGDGAVLAGCPTRPVLRASGCDRTDRFLLLTSDFRPAPLCISPRRYDHNQGKLAYDNKLCIYALSAGCTRRNCSFTHLGDGEWASMLCAHRTGPKACMNMAKDATCNKDGCGCVPAGCAARGN